MTSQYPEINKGHLDLPYIALGDESHDRMRVISLQYFFYISYEPTIQY